MLRKTLYPLKCAVYRDGATCIVQWATFQGTPGSIYFEYF